MADMTNRELLPCPFCGGKASVYSRPTYNADFVGYFVACDTCSAKLGDGESCYFKTHDEAASAWNNKKCASEVSWELTLTIGPARKVLKLVEVAWNEGQGPNTDDIMRAIAWQHPELVEEFSHLPWPGKK